MTCSTHKATTILVAWQPKLPRGCIESPLRYVWGAHWASAGCLLIAGIHPQVRLCFQLCNNVSDGGDRRCCRCVADTACDVAADERMLVPGSCCTSLSTSYP